MPYMNTNYYNQYPQYQPQYSNPYMDRINNLQQYQQSLQPQPPQPQNTLGGKVVDSIDAVKATDIPMDGNLYYFPKADGTEIYAKHWLASGSTEILKYVPTENKGFSESVGGKNNDWIEDIKKRLDLIDEKISRLKPSQRKTNSDNENNK